MARSSLRRMTRSATAVPSALEVRFRPLESRRHQLCFGVPGVVSLMSGSCERFRAMGGSHNRSIPIPGLTSSIPEKSFDVPGLTEEEIQARVLHRDGLMLVIDKPAGLP